MAVRPPIVEPFWRNVAVRFYSDPRGETAVLGLSLSLPAANRSCLPEQRFSVNTRKSEVVAREQLLFGRMPPSYFPQSFALRGAGAVHILTFVKIPPE